MMIFVIHRNPHHNFPRSDPSDELPLFQATNCPCFKHPASQSGFQGASLLTDCLRLKGYVIPAENAGHQRERHREGY